jgi:alkaline phosphatase D
VDITVIGIEVEDQPTRSSTATYAQNKKRNKKPMRIERDFDVEETTILRVSPNPWRILLIGLPSPKSTLLSLATLLINVTLLLAVTDFIYRGKIFHPSDDLSFARVGYVSDKEANLLIREPNQSKMPISVHFRIHNPKPPYESPAWQNVASIYSLNNDTDYTAVIKIPLKIPRPTTYEYLTRLEF